jgi:hypothetical protein
MFDILSLVRTADVCPIGLRAQPRKDKRPFKAILEEDLKALDEAGEPIALSTLARDKCGPL